MDIRYPCSCLGQYPQILLHISVFQVVPAEQGRKNSSRYFRKGNEYSEMGPGARTGSLRAEQACIEAVRWIGVGCYVRVSAVRTRARTALQADVSARNLIRSPGSLGTPL